MVNIRNRLLTIFYGNYWLYGGAVLQHQFLK